MAAAVLPAAHRQRFKDSLEVDIAYSVPGLGRFRCNVFQQRGTIGMVLRVIPVSVRGVDELGLPPVLKKVAAEERGLMLVTGTTGSGKSTTLAAMIDHINHTRVHEHHHHRGPDRIPAPRQLARSSASAKSAPTRSRLPPPSEARCARIRT